MPYYIIDDIPSPEVMYKEFREIQKAGVDVRKDLSDLAGLLEALTGEVCISSC